MGNDGACDALLMLPGPQFAHAVDHLSGHAAERRPQRQALQALHLVGGLGHVQLLPTHDVGLRGGPLADLHDHERAVVVFLAHVQPQMDAFYAFHFPANRLRSHVLYSCTELSMSSERKAPVTLSLNWHSHSCW